MKNKLIRVWKWHIANTTWRYVWRVTYSDGKRTVLLSFHEASGLVGCFGGKMWIDYEHGYF